MNDKLFEIEPLDPVREQVEAEIAAALLITDDTMLEIVGASLGTVRRVIGRSAAARGSTEGPQPGQEQKNG